MRELRGQGYGQAMALRLMSEARSHGAREIWLLTETTRDFFAGLGFVEASRAEAPPALQATSQFAGSRCRAAAAMRRPL
jgi:N-acetylglutamate synthase-like GNAT family acetyltransferase